MTDRIKKQPKKQDFKSKTNVSAEQNKMSQKGKSMEEMLPYLLSGESDDLSNEFFDKI
ncbi:MAG: hypothetical protein PHX02_04025 [Oscillospiraceae bacterium]|nr:hypothetical protein [Oscillospiraceae bacterium]